MKKQPGENKEEEVLDEYKFDTNKTAEIENSLLETPEVVFYETLKKLNKEFNLWNHDLSEDTIKIEYKLNDWWKYTITLNNNEIIVETIWKSNSKTKYYMDKEWSYWSKSIGSKSRTGASSRQQKPRVGLKFNNRWWNTQKSDIPADEIPFDWEKFNKIIDEVIKNYWNCNINIEHE